jgi:phage terminase large subunit-like protein
MTQPDKMLLAAIAKLDKLRLQECFDPINPDSKPTPIQQEVLDDINNHKIQIIRAGNQCKPATSMVLMADGTLKPICEIKEGDLVKSYDSQLRKLVNAPVVRVWKNGVKPVFRYRVNACGLYTDSTENHEMVHISQTYAYKKCRIDTIKKLVFYRPEEVAPAGKVDNKWELLGYLLGDGCFTKLGKNYRGIQFSSKRVSYVDYLQTLLEDGYYWWSSGSGDYYLRSPQGTSGSNRYVNWIRELGLNGCRAGTKFIPQELFEQNTATRWAFLSGLIATDGWISGRKLGFSTTSPDLARGVLLLLWSLGVKGTLFEKIKSSEKHANELSIEVRGTQDLTILKKYLKVPEKNFTVGFKSQRNQKQFSHFTKKDGIYIGDLETYDLTIGHDDHNYICDGYITGNSGKSQTCARIVTWIMTETHPKWTKPSDWGSEPLLCVVAGRSGKQIEESLLPKIRSYLEPGTYKEVRTGNMIQRLELSNGNRIVFQSLENPNMARDRLQSYVAHLVWVDELPPTVDIMNELMVRIQARSGHLLASFTPLVRNIKVQKFVDGLVEPVAKTYRFKMLDNPLYADSARKEEILATMAHLPEHVKNSRLYGEWTSDDNAVYHFNYETMVEMPQNYSPMWRHVESVDPASSSALGYTLWAENPETGVWYCVKAEYIKGIFVPTDIITAVAKLSAPYNIVRRIADPHESWYIHQAASMGIRYTGVYKKNDRKIELIKNFQEALGVKIRIAPHVENLIEEITGARWSDTKEGKIANGSDMHLGDSAQYFVDLMPKRENSLPVDTSWHTQLYQANQKRKQAEMELLTRAIQRRGGNRARRRW